MLVKQIYRRFYVRKVMAYLNPLRAYREFFSKIRSMEDVRYVLRMLGEIWYPFKIKTFSMVKDAHLGRPLESKR
jgi:hypothetical protein